MGYQIDYTPPKKRRLGPMTAGWFLVCLLLVSLLWPRGRQLIATAIFPGDRAVTTAALETTARNLREGQPLGLALEGFCRRILEGKP